MTGLLVSVRTLAEAEQVLATDAEVIDVKEPMAGALGAAPLDVLTAIVQQCAPNRTVSAACGELLDATKLPLQSLPADLSFAKFGLAGCGSVADWPQHLATARDRLPDTVGLVAVAYADWQAVNAPAPPTVIACGAEIGCTHLLIDTADKRSGSLLQAAAPYIDDWARLARKRGMRLVLAGSLGSAEVASVVQDWAPDLVGVRGAVCEDGRTSALSKTKVQHLHGLIRATARDSKIA